MDRTSSERRALYSDYRVALREDILPTRVRPSAWLASVGVIAFVPVDYIFYPELWKPFAALRLASVGGNLALGYVLGRTRAELSLFSIAILTALVLLTMTAATGGATSPYYSGLMLLIIAIPVIAPYTAGQVLLTNGLLTLGYALLPLLDQEPIDPQVFGLHFVFLALATGVSTVCAATLDQSRFSEFIRLREIESARDQLQALDGIKTRFTANVHHELRTPLTLMLAPLEGMLGGDFGSVSDLQRSYMHSMRSNGLRLLKLINNLLDFAKIESGQLEISRQPTRIGALADQIASGARPMAEQKGIELRVEGLAELPEINVDPDAIEKVLVNLVGNALKFTPNGHITVSGSAESDGGVHLIVADTGMGLPATELERVFDRFAQVDSSSTRRHEGTGIGLSLVLELIELHGGRVWVESDGPGEGSQFHVVLPLGECDRAGADEVIQSIAGDSARLRREIDAIDGGADRDELRYGEMQREAQRESADDDSGVIASAATKHDARTPEVLICEDNRDMRRLIAHLVSEEFRVRVAINGREGLEMARETAPDLILTDVMMPEMSGTELCRAVKDDARLAHIPVILVTSKADRDMKVEGLELGADDYVTKPFHPRELMARVRSSVTLRVARKELDRQNALLESTNEELRAALEELHEAGIQLAKSERLAAVGELAAGVAHEINNPMNFAMNALRTMGVYVGDVTSVANAYSGIDWSQPDAVARRMGEIDKMRDACDFDEAAAALTELLEIVTEGLDRTQRLVGDLRDFAAGDGSHGEIDIARGLKTTIQLIGHAARDANVQLRLDIADPLPRAEGDPRAINQVFLNLLKNATEVLERRGGHIDVSAKAVGGKILVEIRDDGPGVASEAMSQIFEPFFTTKEAGRGAGLGLSISRRIVDEHNGDLELISAGDEGAIFRVTLPCQEEPNAAPA